MLVRASTRLLARRFATDAKPVGPRISTAQRHMLDLNGDGKVDFDDVRYAVSQVSQDRQGKIWAAVFGTMFFAAYGGLNLFSRLQGERPEEEKFFKWGGVYSRFFPEAGKEVSAKWGVKLTGPGGKEA